MITDHLSNAHLYTPLSAGIKRAFEYIKQTDLHSLPVGRIEVDGKNMYVTSQEYTTKLPESAGDFMIMFPNDAHMPGMTVNNPVPVKKVVVKILV